MSDWRGLDKDIDKAITDAFKGRRRTAPSADWTRMRNVAMQTVASKWGYQARYSNKDRNWEFMFDLSLIELYPPSGGAGCYYFSVSSPLRRLIAAVESEWNQSVDEILRDFTKLLVVRAPVKVMLCYQTTKQKVNVVFTAIVKAIQAYSDRVETDLYRVYVMYPRGFKSQLFNGSGEMLVE